MKSKIYIAIALIGLFAAACNKAQAPQQTGQRGTTQNNASQQTAQNKNPQTPPGGVDGRDIQVAGVSITANGFSPATITIHQGDYVMFTNKDTEPHWPASNPHPSHTDYPGFDAKHALSPGQTYTFKFDRVGTWGYHDHLNPSTGGTVIVK